MKQNQYGRSMIEMLGVLAIVGVLSIGGIAGYSKAMEMWKVNKLVNEYRYLVFGMLDYLDNIKKAYMVTDGSKGFVDIVKALGVQPENWKVLNASSFADEFGNRIQLFYSNNSAVFEFYLDFNNIKNENKNRNTYLCREIFDKLAVPLHPLIRYANVWRGTTSTPNDAWMGDKQCDAELKCLKDISMVEINKLCQTCSKDNTGNCSVILVF